MSQDNSSPLSLQDLIPGGSNYLKYRNKSLQQPQWWNDKLIHVKEDSILTIPTNKDQMVQVILTKDQLNKSLLDNNKKRIKRVGLISFPYANESIIMIRNGNDVYLYNFEKQELIGSYEFSDNSTNLDFSKENQTFAYTRDNNLYLKNILNEDIPITNESNEGIVYGQPVHRNEFGIKKGTFWSPSGNKLAFYRMDETMVTDYPLVDISSRVAKLKDIKYPMAGMKSHQVKVGIYNPETKDTIYLKTGLPKEKYLTNIAWSPDEKHIYIAELNRGQDTCTLVKYNATTGLKEKVLFSEIHPKYVEPENPTLFVPNNPNLFIWQSKKDGHNHLYLYDTDGNQKKQTTTGNWDITNIIGFDNSGNKLYYTSTEASPIEQQIYEINLKTGKKIQLSASDGVHQGLLSDDGKYIADIYTSQYNPGKIDLIDIKKNKIENLYTSKNPYKDIALPEISIGSIKANDGNTDLYYRLIKPLNFDPNKRYPTVIYVYGGPHSQLVDNSWMAQARGWDIYMAEKGYVVFTLDNRGTSNRGLDFENITHRHLGVTETQDQMAGVDFLKSLPYIDQNRIGVHGWSYGGFMTLNLMLRHPETFKVGVAGGPVTDWKYYEIMYGERYMDSPKENPKGYAETSMVDKAGNLEGRLMIIHGDEDPTVVMQHSLQFLKSAINKGTHPDFFVYPGHGHNMIGKDRVHLHEHITRYFDDFFK